MPESFRSLPVTSGGPFGLSGSYLKRYHVRPVGVVLTPGHATASVPHEMTAVFFGTPKTVIPKLRRVLEETRPSIYGIWGNDGTVSNEDARTCIRLLGQEVMPAMREIGKELGLKDPFELNAPVHLKYSTDLKQMPQAAE